MIGQPTTLLTPFTLVTRMLPAQTCHLVVKPAPDGDLVDLMQPSAAVWPPGGALESRRYEVYPEPIT